MNTMALDDFVRIYSDRRYDFPTMVQHQGKVIAFAMERDERDRYRIFYTVLDLDRTDVTSPLDANYWLDNPRELRFPDELAYVGYGIADQIRMPVVRRGAPLEDLPPGTKIREDEKYVFRSSTARLSAEAPFQALSDGRYLYLFRQSIAKNDSNNVKVNDIAVVDNNLLVDRFLLVGNELKRKREVRYRRSRSRYRPANRKDSLGAKDMDDQPFYEPTQKLGFIRHMKEGWFSVLLVPTQAVEIQRWHIFAYNGKAGHIDIFDVERSADGLFNLAGTQLYTCVDHPELLELKDGTCTRPSRDDATQLCNKRLIPQASKTEYAESALLFDGQTASVTVPSFPAKELGDFTVEAWIKIKIEEKGCRQQIISLGEASGGISLYVTVDGKLACDMGTEQEASPTSTPISGPVSDAAITGSGWYHVALVHNGSTLQLYVDGRASGDAVASPLDILPKASGATIGAVSGQADPAENWPFQGTIDEVRIWEYARSPHDLQAGMHQRLRADEWRLAAYWRFDEARGERVYDHSDSGHEGRLNGGIAWVTSDAPIGQNPGLSRDRIRFENHRIETGPSAIFYYQQEEAATGHDQSTKPLKQNARVMLATGTTKVGEPNLRKRGYIAVLDIGVSRDGRLAQMPDVIDLREINFTSQPYSISPSMPILHLDPVGLTINGARLDMRTLRTPYLFESATGEVGLYSQAFTDPSDERGHFDVARYETLAEKARYEIGADPGDLTFVARSTEPELDKLSISISDDDNAGDAEKCKVVIKCLGIEETWHQVSRKPQQFADTINGQSDDYKYDKWACFTRVPSRPRNGSLLVRVVGNDMVSVPVQNADSIPLAIPPDKKKADACHWITVRGDWVPVFDGRLRVYHDAPEKFDADGDLTIEAWVDARVAGQVNQPAVLIQQKAAINYALGYHWRDLDQQEKRYSKKRYQVWAIVGDNLVITKNEEDSTGAKEEWTHVAVVFNQAYAVQLQGEDAYLDCGPDTTLDISGDLTLELSLNVASGPESSRQLISKGSFGGDEQDVPYALFIEQGRYLRFSFQDTDHTLHSIQTVVPLPTGYRKIAVTRQRVTTEGEKVDPADHIKLYIDGQEQSIRVLTQATQGSPTEDGKTFRYRGKSAGSSNEPLIIGRFQGQVSEVRIWNTARSAQDISGPIKGQEKGLVSWWRLEEREGNVAYDSKSTNHAKLKGNATFVKDQAPGGSSLTIYLDGRRVPTSSYTLDDAREKISGFKIAEEEQFTLGAMKSVNEDYEQRHHGRMTEVRLWKTVRTQEQIQDNLFRRLLGEEEDLIAYYSYSTFADEQPSIWEDDSSSGNHLTLAGASRPTDASSPPPIGKDAPQVHNVGLFTQTFWEIGIHSRPAVQEYGDLQTDAEGNLIGVFKRCYTFINTDWRWELITGFKVGNLVTEWIGQVQTNPQLIGYVEGAPPVPGENLTMPGADYSGATAVELTQAESTTYTYASSSEASLGFSLEFSVEAGFKSKSEAGSPVFLSDVEDTKIMAGVRQGLAFAWSSQQASSQGRELTSTRASSLSLRGYWLEGRFMPDNVGIALVQSETADIFALRLQPENVLVAYQMRPNPDIPPDWNIITFPLNPVYTKQGTLDGKLGDRPDLHYPNAKDYSPDISYFKPIEAYSLKNRITREEQELKAFYDQLAAESEGKGGGQLSELRKDLTRLAKHNIVNTYVWTAEGGLFAETQENMDILQESLGGSFLFETETGFSLTAALAIMKVATRFELQAMFTTSAKKTLTKTQDSTTAFGLEVTLDGVEHDIYERDANGKLKINRDDERNPKPEKESGKVDAYRFMTFYLEPSAQNFGEFFNKVVDPIWLDSDEPNAAALRQANQGGTQPPCWRILHRVTFVSRVHQRFDDRGTSELEQAMQEMDVASNYELIKRLEPFVQGKTHSYNDFRNAIFGAIDKYMPALHDHRSTIVQYLCLYFGVPEEPSPASANGESEEASQASASPMPAAAPVAAADQKPVSTRPMGIAPEDEPVVGRFGTDNPAPLVSAGADQTITLPAKTRLAGKVTQDTLVPDKFALQWAQASGPGTAMFTDGNALATEVAFSQAGRYVLSLTAKTERHSVRDEVTIVVNRAPVVKPGPKPPEPPEPPPSGWHMEVEHRPGAKIIAGSLPEAGIQLTVTDPWGNATTTVSGSKLEYGAGGFEVLAGQVTTYTLAFRGETFEVQTRDGATIVTFARTALPPSQPG